MLDTIKVLRELKDNRVDVYFEQENIYLLDRAAQHVIEMYCAFGQDESENKGHSGVFRPVLKPGHRGIKTFPATSTGLMRRSKACPSCRTRLK